MSNLWIFFAGLAWLVWIVIVVWAIVPPIRDWWRKR